MTVAKRIISACFGTVLLFGFAPTVSATVANVTFTSTINSPLLLGSAGDTWTLSFVVDNGDSSFDWGVGDIQGDVLGSVGAYSATFGTDLGGGSFDLSTDALGNVQSANYSDLQSADNSDSFGGAVLLDTTNVTSSGGVPPFAFAFFDTATNEQGLGWTVEIETQQGGGGDPVPEPGAIALLGLGLLGLAAVRRRSRKV